MTITQAKQKNKYYASILRNNNKNESSSFFTMAKQSKPIIDKYNATFPTILRALEEHHPADGRSTTHKALAEAVGVRPQTISLYAIGDTQPTPDTLLKIAQYFGVSVDYLLTGVSSQNQQVNETLGLSEEAIQLLKLAKQYNKATDFPLALELINGLLSDKEFYEFLDDLGYKASQFQIIARHEAAKNIDLNLGGYYLWDMQMFVQDFIRRQLVKNGLDIELN